ncbi:TldD/PmbA family protein [Nanoarchaeota archaeon]
MKFRNKLKAILDHISDDQQSLQRKKGEEEPYFESYLLLSRKTDEFLCSNGAIVDEQYSSDDNTLRVEVRVGDYGFDGMGSITTGVFPITDDYTATRNLLWSLTQPAYHHAQLNYLRKCRDAVDSEQPLRTRSFSSVNPVEFEDKMKKRNDSLVDRWQKVLTEGSARFNEHPEILSGRLKFTLEEMMKVYVNTEGASIVQQDVNYMLHMEASARAPEDGEHLVVTRRYLSKNRLQFPRKKELENVIDWMILHLKELRSAPVQSAGQYPVMFDPDNTEVLFHEIVGHRLEGERQERDWEGDTFEGSIGRKIAPDFVNLVDDPTRKLFRGVDGVERTMFGHYLYDDEGVPAKKVVLIKKGVLQNYLLSRKPIVGYDVPPNGHGRCDGTEDPIARMSNLMARSSRPLSQDKLEELLIEQCLRQDKDYGIIFKGSSGGHTDTSDDNFRLFPQQVYRLWARDAVDPQTGKRFTKGEQQLVRGVEVAGTPLMILNNMLGMGKDYRIWPGHCGAESGWVKVCGAAPSSVFSKIEVIPNSADRLIDNPHPKPSTYLAKKR